MKLSELFEGGWASKLTQNTIITPKLVEIAYQQYNKFVEAFNIFLKSKDIPEVKSGHPVGSTNYYKKDLLDNPEKEYGDIDILLFIPKLPEKTDAQIADIFKKLVLEFCSNRTDVSTDNGNAVIFKIGQDYVQVDLVFSYFQNKEWLKALVPEHNFKGILSASLYSSLAELLNLSISSYGVQAKIRDNMLVSFRQSKDVKLVTVSKNPSEWALDILKFYHNIINPEDSLIISKSLQAHPGINPESLKVVDIISAIHGLSDSFTENDYFGHGPLSEIMDAQDFINNLKVIYTKKIMSRIQDSKLKQKHQER